VKLTRLSAVRAVCADCSLALADCRPGLGLSRQSLTNSEPSDAAQTDTTNPCFFSHPWCLGLHPHAVADSCGRIHDDAVACLEPLAHLKIRPIVIFDIEFAERDFAFVIAPRIRTELTPTFERDVGLPGWWRQTAGGSPIKRWRMSHTRAQSPFTAPPCSRSGP
jgi:hypothetical protein